jgi:hypothetical protein
MPGSIRTRISWSRAARWTAVGEHLMMWLAWRALMYSSADSMTGVMAAAPLECAGMERTGSPSGPVQAAERPVWGTKPDRPPDHNALSALLARNIFDYSF